ncbi:MAG TPA: NUDIX domain-containing protein [Arenicellales bacterium]|nr:NUDIX domain-containing protein [Arenicellales bacterium]
MSRHSAGILLYRIRDGRLQVLLAHPGGPYWARRDEGAWSIPKGLIDADEDPLAAARREFREETGCDVDGNFVELGSVRQPGGKLVQAWALEHDLDPSTLHSNRFTMEWPPHSGQFRDFPEIDRAQWFCIDDAREKILKGQREFLQRLQRRIGDPERRLRAGDDPGSGGS